MHPNYELKYKYMNMKSIQNIGILFLAFVLSINLTSCEKEYVSELQTLVIQDMTFDVKNELQEQVFANHDLSNYSIKSSESWCVARIDVEHARILVNVQANDTYDVRTATITISDFKDGVSSKTFKVTQDSKKGIIIDENTYTVPMAGGNVSIVIKQNVDFQVLIPQADASWISLVQSAFTRGLEPKTITFNVAKNNSGTVRQSTITVYNEQENLSLSFLIRQSFEASFDYSPKSLEFDELGGKQTVDVTANFPLATYVDYWLALKQENIDDTHIKYTVSASPFTEKKEKRISKFIIQNTTVGKKAEIVVTQYRTLFINASEMTVEVGKYIALEGDEILVNRNNIEVEYSSTNPEVATVNADGIVEGKSPGVAIINVSSLDGNYKDYMYVNVEKPYNWQDDVTATWEYEYDSATGKVKAVNCTFKNNTSSSIYLSSYTLYNDNKKIAEGEPQKNLSSKQEYSLTTSKAINDPDKPYWIEWEFTYDAVDYKMTYDQAKTKKIEKKAAASRSRSRK